MYAQPLVSVVMIFLDAQEYLREAIDSVLAQTYERWELFLVDDGSTDASTEIARGFAARFPQKIRYLEHPGHQNLGTGAARNLGIRNAKGDYIAFLDSDDYWLPSRLETHVGILDACPEAGMLFGSAKYWYSWTGRPEDSRRDHLPLRRVRAQTLFHPPSLMLRITEETIEIPCTCSILVRSDVAQKVEGFPEIFRGLYEDQAFYAKISLAAPVLATDDCLAWYRQHPKSICTTAIASGRRPASHLEFLNWLARYYREQRLKDPRVLQAIHRQLWLHGVPSHSPLPGISQGRMRWIKKWLLKLEERVLPSMARNWLWMRDQK